MSKEKKEETKDELEDELEKQWALQDEIHHKCKMRDDPETKKKKWNEKYK